MPLKIIGAGHGRTGTKTLQLALEGLGVGRCYHGGEQVYKHRSRGWNLWLRAFKRESIDWDEIFDGYAATVDTPGCLFYRELASEYPAAKVILTVRESLAWYESAFAVYLSPEGIASFMASAAPEERELMEHELSVGFGSRLDKNSVVAAYERHNAEVQDTIPSQRLLVYDVRQGWEPLCSFLGVPQPDIPFPHSHARK